METELREYKSRELPSAFVREKWKDGVLRVRKTIHGTNVIEEMFKDGLVIVVSHFKRGKLSEKRGFVYNEKGQKIQITTFKGDRKKLKSIQKIEYNAHGQEVRLAGYNGKKELVFVNETTYNSFQQKKQKVGVLYLNGYKITNFIQDFLYDAMGTPTGEIFTQYENDKPCYAYETHLQKDGIEDHLFYIYKDGEKKLFAQKQAVDVVARPSLENEDFSIAHRNFFLDEIERIPVKNKVSVIEAQLAARVQNPVLVPTQSAQDTEEIRKTLPPLCGRFGRDGR